MLVLNHQLITRTLLIQYELLLTICLLYTSDAADDLLCVDLGGRRLIKKKNKNIQIFTFLSLRVRMCVHC